VKLQSNSTGKIVVELYDLQGALINQVYQGEIRTKEEINKVILGQGLAKGVYVLRATQHTQVIYKRIMVN